MNRNFVASARKQLLRRGRALLRAAQASAGPGARPGIGAMAEAELTELQEIHAALERIERGIYGRCEDCQGSIEEARAAQVPWARLCAACGGEPLPVEAELPAPL